MSNNIVQFNEEIIKGQIKELVRGSVEETLNELLEAEAEKLTQAARYERSERSSTIVTTNLAFSERTQLFENTTMVAALVDRLTYRSHVLDMSGPSYRLLTAQAENEAATAASTAG